MTEEVAMYIEDKAAGPFIVCSRNILAKRRSLWMSSLAALLGWFSTSCTNQHWPPPLQPMWRRCVDDETGTCPRPSPASPVWESPSPRCSRDTSRWCSGEPCPRTFRPSRPVVLPSSSRSADLRKCTSSWRAGVHRRWMAQRQLHHHYLSVSGCPRQRHRIDQRRQRLGRRTVMTLEDSK